MQCSLPALRLCQRARHGLADAARRCNHRPHALQAPLGARLCSAVVASTQLASDGVRNARLSCRSAVAFRCYASSTGEPKREVPATFVAPEKVDMSQFPPPSRGVNKGAARLPLAVCRSEDDVIVHFVRSQGAGGQNVNKVNTKADLRFKVSSAEFLPQWVKDNLVVQEKNRMNSDGELVIAAQRHRTQKANLEDAIEKLQEMLDEAATPPTGPSDETIKKVKNMAVKANRKRLEDKKRESMRKKERGGRGADWD